MQNESCSCFFFIRECRFLVFVYQLVGTLGAVHFDMYIETSFSVHYLVAFLFKNYFIDIHIVDIFPMHR